ncbi:MAG: cytochrome c oxidase subunit 2A [Thermoflexales bacterium]|nr:cytochrome c oxidase subunit 2A [Thermoflexales bacterium]
MAPKKPEPNQSEQQPKGTLVIVFTYMVTIIVLWSWVYLTLIERGVTR